MFHAFVATCETHFSLPFLFLRLCSKLCTWFAACSNDNQYALPVGYVSFYIPQDEREGKKRKRWTQAPKNEQLSVSCLTILEALAMWKRNTDITFEVKKGILWLLRELKTAQLATLYFTNPTTRFLLRCAFLQI